MPGKVFIDTSVSDVRKLVLMLEASCRVELIGVPTIHRALDVRQRYGFSWYDSLIVATAILANCETLFSEDLQSGQVIDGCLRVENPFR